jgi:hypothetical protein
MVAVRLMVMALLIVLPGAASSDYANGAEGEVRSGRP